MTDNGTTITIERPSRLGLEWEMVGFRAPVEGEHYWDGDEVRLYTTFLALPYLIVRKREPQPGPWQDGYEWTGEVCLGRDIARRVATSERSNWVANDYSQGRFCPKPEFIYFILQPKSKPRLSEGFKRWGGGYGTDTFVELVAKIEARETVIAEVIAELREIGEPDGRLYDLSDKLEAAL